MSDFDIDRVAIDFPSVSYDSWKTTEPVDPYEVDETPAELAERVQRTSERAKKWIAEWDSKGD